MTHLKYFHICCLVAILNPKEVNSMKYLNEKEVRDGETSI